MISRPKAGKSPTDRPKLSWQSVLAGLDIKLLRVFMAVVEEDGFVGAQARLNIAPSTLSEHIKDLEFRLGFTVCLRGRRGFKLTAQGESLYEAARTLFGQLETFRNRISEISNRSEGRLNIGVVDGLATENIIYLPDILRAFSKEKSSVEINLTISSPPDLEVALLEGRLDAAVGPFSVKRPGLHYDFLYQEKQSLFCGRGCALFGVDYTKALEKDIVQTPLVMCDYPSMDVIQSFDSSIFVRTLEAVTLLVLSGRYIGYLPRHTGLPYVNSGQLWEINESKYSYGSDFSVISRDVSVKDPALKLLLALLRRAAASGGS